MTSSSTPNNTSTVTVHRYSYYIKPKANPSPIMPMNDIVSIDERLQDDRDLEVAIISCVIAIEGLDCAIDDLKLVSFEYLPEKDDE